MRKFTNSLMVSMVMLCVQVLVPKAAMAFSTGATQIKPRPSLTCTGPRSRYTIFDAAPTLDPTQSRSVTLPYFQVYADCPAPFSPNVLLRERASRLSDYLRSAEIVEDGTGTVVGVAEPMVWENDAREHWTNLRFHAYTWVHVAGSTTFSLRLNFDTNTPAPELDGVMDILLPEESLVRNEYSHEYEVTVGGNRFINMTDLLVETPSPVAATDDEETPQLRLDLDALVPPDMGRRSP
jgi:hypothetical protein